jgi:uncharacterized membrane protein
MLQSRVAFGPRMGGCDARTAGVSTDSGTEAWPDLRNARLPYLGRALFWLALATLVGFVLQKTIAYRFLAPGRLGPSLWDRQAWFYSHALFGTLALLLGAAQFNPWLRRTRPRVHRWTGRAYVALAVLGSLAGIWLALHSDGPGRRAPLALLGLLWLWFTLDGWRRARARDFAAHRLLMIRSYVVALVFVWARLLAMPPVAPILFGFIPDPPLREATAIWISVVGPVLLMHVVLGPVPPFLRALRADHHP